MIRSAVITQKAKSDLRSYFLLAADNAPHAAENWLNRFEAALETLSTNAERCSVAPEDSLFEEVVRHFYFGKGVGKFRALFLIRESQVLIVHIRRGTMDTADADDFK